MTVSQSFSEAVIAAEQAWRAADHVLRVTFPVVQDPKLLLRVLEHLDKALHITISTILKREYIYQRIPLKRSGAENTELFFSSCASLYGVSTADSVRLREVLDLGRRHKASGSEFSQKGKVIILDDEVGSVVVSAGHLEELSLAVRGLQMQLQKEFKESSKGKELERL